MSSLLAERLRDLAPQIKGTGLYALGHADVKAAANAIDALEKVARQYINDMRFPNLSEEQRNRRIEYANDALALLDNP
jgi:hypothetical protein